MAARFPPPRETVPGFVTEGLNLLAGGPKIGKSWLAMGLCVAVAAGGWALGRVPVKRGDALYLALEDPPRRLQDRLGKVLAGAAPPDGLHLETVWPALIDGGAEQLDAWLAAHPACRLVVVDVFARVRGAVSDRADRYAGDYAAMLPLKQLADRHRVAVLVLHHTRKQAADDYLDTVSGTQGVAGAADTVLVLRRSRGRADAELHVTGRDVEEADHALTFAPETGTWALAGSAAEAALSEPRRRILDLLRERGEPMGPKQVADALGMAHDAVRQTMTRMADADQLVTDGPGRYTPSPTLSQRSHLSQGREPHDGDCDGCDRCDTPGGRYADPDELDRGSGAL